MDTRTPSPDRLVYGCMGLGGGWDRDTYDASDLAAAEAAV